MNKVSTYKVLPISKLLKLAELDTDPVSFWWLHDNPEPALERMLKGRLRADGAVLIIKGDQAAQRAFKLLCDAGLLTPLKPVDGDAFCKYCGKPIRLAGKVWAHINSTPRHPARPIREAA